MAWMFKKLGKIRTKSDNQLAFAIKMLYNYIMQKVTDTAIPMAFVRAQAGIPYAKEIWDALDIKDFDPYHTISPVTGKPYFSRGIMNIDLIRWEARGRLTDKILSQTGINQILCLGSGFCPRGINLASANDKVTYVEFDLPEQAQKKKQILSKIKTPPPEFAHCWR